jgi:hypothetical protein
MVSLIDILPANFDANSKVWVYQASRLFSMQEVFDLEDILNNFVDNWKSHGTPVKGFATVLYGQFIIIMADETATGVSGCSTDSSVHVVKEIEKKFTIDLFNRQNMAFYINNKVQLLPLAHCQHAFENGFLKPDTLFFNNLVVNKNELVNNWLITVDQTWLGKRFLQKA